MGWSAVPLVIAETPHGRGRFTGGHSEPTVAACGNSPGGENAQMADVPPRDALTPGPSPARGEGRNAPSRDELASRYLDQLPFPPYPVQEEALLTYFTAEQGVLV